MNNRYIETIRAQKIHRKELWDRYIPAVATDTTKYPMMVENLWSLGDFLNGTGTQKTLEGLNPNKTYTVLIKASSDYSTTGTAWSVSPRNADASSRGNLFYMNNYVAGQTVSAEFNGASMLRIQGANFSGSFYICLVEGSATIYVPYGSWKFVSDIETKTKNLFDGGERGTYVSTSGGKTDNDTKFRSKNKIPVVAGQTYSNNIINKPSWATFAQLNIFGYDAQGAFLWAGTSSVNAWSIGSPFTMPENTAYITVSTFGSVVNSDARVAELNEKFIIVEGSTVPTAYEPYGNIFGYFNEATTEFVKALGAAGTVMTKVAYAESTGTQYFDLERTFDNSTKIEFTMTRTGINQNYTSADSRGNVWFGNNGTTGTELMLGWGGAGTTNYFRGTGSGTFGNWKPTLNTKYHIEFTYEKGNGQLYVDGEKKGNTATMTNSTDVRSILIGAVRDNSATIIYCKEKFHNEIKLWNGNTLLAHYLPVRVGQTVELLDQVNWKFATRTGTFTAGADLAYKVSWINSFRVVAVDGKNLVDFNETRINSTTWATADKSKGFEIIADVYNKVVGNALGTNGNCFGAFVPCRKGESISLNFFDYAPYYGRCFYCEVDADFKVLTTPVQYSNGVSAVTQRTFTATNDNCIGFAIEWYLNGSQTRNYTKDNYMVVSGTTVPTAYSPYGKKFFYTIHTKEV